MTKLKELESDLMVTKERCQEQAKDLLTKSGRFSLKMGMTIWLAH